MSYETIEAMLDYLDEIGFDAGDDDTDYDPDDDRGFQNLDTDFEW